MARTSSLAILICLIFAHVALSAMYAVQTPYRTAGVVLTGGGPVPDIGNPDERQHANYIARLLRGQGFAVLDPNDPNQIENYQAHQPPLYYVVAAGWHKTLEAIGLAKHVTDRLPIDSPSGVTVQEVQIPDGFPARALNMVIGALNVVGVFFLAWWAYRRETLALAAAAFAAFLPMNVALSGAISNDPLLVCLCTWTLALVALSISEGWNLKRALLVGILTGLAMLTKTTALALVPALLIAVFIPQYKKPTAVQIATVAAATLILSIPWWIRNQSLYGDPFALKAFNLAFQASKHRTDFVGTIIPQAQPGANPNVAYWVDWVGFWTMRSFFGVFGYMDIWLTKTGYASSSFDGNRLYWVLFGMMVVAAIGWLLSWREQDFAKARPITGLFMAFTLVVVVLFLRFNYEYFQAQARYILPALGPISAAVALGASTLAKKRTWLPLGSVAFVLLCVNAFALVRIGPQFQQRIEMRAALQQAQTEPAVHP